MTWSAFLSLFLPIKYFSWTLNSHPHKELIYRSGLANTGHSGFCWYHLKSHNWHMLGSFVLSSRYKWTENGTRLRLSFMLLSVAEFNLVYIRHALILTVHLEIPQPKCAVYLILNTLARGHLQQCELFLLPHFRVDDSYLADLLIPPSQPLFLSQHF